MRLNGWQRLWVVAIVLWAAVVSVAAYLLAPASLPRSSELDSLTHNDNWITSGPSVLPMQTDGNPTSADASLPKGWSYLSTDPKAGLALDPNDYRELLTSLTSNIASTREEARKLMDKLTVAERRTFIDYYHERINADRAQRRMVALAAVVAWILPSILVYMLGWSIAWIRRGFTAQP